MPWALAHCARVNEKEEIERKGEGKKATLIHPRSPRMPCDPCMFPILSFFKTIKIVMVIKDKIFGTL